MIIFLEYITGDGNFILQIIVISLRVEIFEDIFDFVIKNADIDQFQRGIYFIIFFCISEIVNEVFGNRLNEASLITKHEARFRVPSEQQPRKTEFLLQIQIIIHIDFYRENKPILIESHCISVGSNNLPFAGLNKSLYK